MLKFAGCMKCGNNTFCEIGTVYYSRILSQTSSMQNKPLTIQTNTITRYSIPEKWDVPICKECIIKRKKLNLILTPILTLIFAFFVCAFTEFNNLALYILGSLWLLVLGITIITLLRKKYKTNFSANDIFIPAKEALKERLEKNSKAKYEFWPKYPSHLK